MDSQPTVVRFSLSDVPESEREMTLREVFGRAVMNMDFKPLTERPDFGLECQILPGALITRSRQTAHVVTSSHDPSRDNDDFALVWGSAGGDMSQRGKKILSEAGPVLISCAESTRSETWRSVASITIRLNRALLLSVLPGAERLMMKQPISPDNEAFRLLENYLSVLRAAQPYGSELGRAAAVHICDLIALAFGTAGDSREIASSRGLRSARLDVIKRWVIARLSVPSLTIASAAAAQGLSPRYVQMLFSEAGPTFSEFVLNKRLRLAHRYLCNRNFDHRAISSIAYDAGFNDVSYFNRAFKAAYGATPSDVRARSLAEGADSSF